MEEVVVTGVYCTWKKELDTMCDNVVYCMEELSLKMMTNVTVVKCIERGDICSSRCSPDVTH